MIYLYIIAIAFMLICLFKGIYLYATRNNERIPDKYGTRVDYFRIAQLEMTIYGHLWENPDSPYTGQTHLWPNPVTREWVAVPYPAKEPRFIPRMVDDMAQEKFYANNPPWTDYVAGSDGN